ncbi:MAG: hypothetical protein D6704_04370 [Nitrospirae bacterium]|nr:MAG: hypothetical protein D6704_04370 [Nitrospirota bacterium]
MGRWLKAGAVGVAILVVAGGHKGMAEDFPSHTQIKEASPIPQEPEEFDAREVRAYYDWRNDLFFREFDMDGSGSVDFMTARRTYKVWLDDFGTPVVLTVGSPLFYWVDLNHNGEFESAKGEMWSDPEEDGVTGNERLYDSTDLQSHPSRIPLWVAPTPDAKPYHLPPCEPLLGCAE